MFSRIALLLVTLFWVVMNFLLWRSEFGGRPQGGTSVPVEMVWQKMLIAPDASSLEILHHGQRLGTCRWSASVGQELAAAALRADEAPVEGLTEKVANYRIDFDGTAAMGDGPNRIRFDLNLTFTTNHAWQELNARVNLRPDIWEIHSRAAEKTLHVHDETEGEKSDRVYKFSDLQDPRFLIEEFQLPITQPMLEAFGLPAGASSAIPLSAGLAWEARNDRFTLGHTSMRAYRLQARLFGRFQMVIIVSPVGEILRVELPDEWLLVNEQLTSF